MGVKSYLIEGVSGTGKTTVTEELQRRGYHVIHGDRELSYVGDPETIKKAEPADCRSDAARLYASAVEKQNYKDHGLAARRRWHGLAVSP